MKLKSVKNDQQEKDNALNAMQSEHNSDAALKE